MTNWISKPKLRLLGVKATLKSVAEMLELAWHGFRDLDSIMRSLAAEASGRALAARSSRALENEGNMAGEAVGYYGADAWAYSGRARERGSAKPAAASVSGSERTEERGGS